MSFFRAALAMTCVHCGMSLPRFARNDPRRLEESFLPDT